jgi:hypothetical protein
MTIPTATSARARPWTIAAPLALVALLAVGGCQKKALTADPTPPSLVMLKWERTSGGTQGSQTTVPAGGSFAVSAGWLGETKSDGRVVASDPEGVRVLTVSGAATGKCSTNPDKNGTVYSAPSPLSASFPPQTETAPAGYVKDGMTSHIDKLVPNPSCGVHVYNGMPGPAEFFMDTATWTITAHAENCCGGAADTKFTMAVN